VYGLDARVKIGVPGERMLYIHTYIHTYTHTYKQTCMHAYIHKHMHTQINTYIHLQVHTYIYISSCSRCACNVWTRRRNADDVPPCRPHRPARRGSNGSHLARTSIFGAAAHSPDTWPRTVPKCRFNLMMTCMRALGLGQIAGRLRTGVAGRARCCCTAHGARLCRLCCRSADCPSTLRSTFGTHAAGRSQ
jgi:hypothetical protein